jgi:hypothetical protein
MEISSVNVVLGVCCCASAGLAGNILRPARAVASLDENATSQALQLIKAKAHVRVTAGGATEQDVESGRPLSSGLVCTFEDFLELQQCEKRVAPQRKLVKAAMHAGYSVWVYRTGEVLYRAKAVREMEAPPPQPTPDKTKMSKDA